jgi:hypothetical protein
MCRTPCPPDPTRQGEGGEADSFKGMKESDRYGKKEPPAGGRTVQYSKYSNAVVVQNSKSRKQHSREGAGVLTGANAGEEEVEKEGVNMAVSGALTEDTNTFNGVVIKYSEPPEARSEAQPGFSFILL